MFTSLISLYLATIIGNTTNLNITETGTSQFQNVLSAHPVPQTTVASGLSDPNIQASAYLSMDMRSGKILAQKNENERRAIGSITKLITALIVLDENNLNDIVKVPDEATKVGGSVMWLASGERITIRDLLLGMLIPSGNDAAYTLAINNAGSIEAFVTKMNIKARKLGLTQTHFGNPAGLDVNDNYSTTADIATLGVFAYRNAFIRYAVAFPKLTVSSVNGQFKHELVSTDGLLTKDPRMKGLKTGHTLDAGYSFVGIATVPNGSPILTVVLDSPNRFKETTSLVDWSIANFTW